MKNDLKDGKTYIESLQRYGHYWYVQEYKFNRMLEEKTMIAVLLKYIMNIEILSPKMSAVSLYDLSFTDLILTFIVSKAR